MKDKNVIDKHRPATRINSLIETFYLLLNNAHFEPPCFPTLDKKPSWNVFSSLPSIYPASPRPCSFLCNEPQSFFNLLWNSHVGQLQRKYTAWVEKWRYLKCLYRAGKCGLKSLLLWFFTLGLKQDVLISKCPKREEKKKVGNINARCGSIRLWWK